MKELKTHTQRACLNCGTALNESFCSHCGQRDQEVKRPLIGLLKELFHAIFELDGRAYRTVFFLFCKPAYLTLEYIEGRRVSFTPPLRLFLILSIIFFFMISANSLIQTLDSSLSGEADKNSEFLANSSASEEDIDGDQAELSNGLAEVIDFIDNIVVPSLSEETNTNLVAFISTQVQANFKRITDDPKDFFYGSLDYITFFILLMMPFLAMILKALYFFSKQFYVEHIILTLHNHTFLILAMIIRMPLNLMGEGTVMIISPLANLVSTLLAIWMVIYLFLSLKVYFGQGYLLTTFKFITATILYGILLGIGFAVFMALFFIFS